jgi:hypothetical protein
MTCPQTDFCRFNKFYSVFNFIGSFERMIDEGPALLKKLGVWKKYGHSGWSIAGQIKSNIIPPKNQSSGRERRYNLTYPSV